MRPNLHFYLFLPFLVLSCFFSAPVNAQTETHNFITYDTTVNFSNGNWNLRITRPAGMFTANNPDTASRPAIIFMVGSGEITNPAYMQTYGPHYWLNNGWNGGIQLGNGTHYPILITVQPYTTGPTTRSAGNLLLFLLNTYHIKSNAVHLTGLSMGAIQWERLLNAQQSPGDFTYMKRITSVAAFSGQGNPYGDSLQGAAWVLGGDITVAPNWGGAQYWVQNYHGKYLTLEGISDNVQAYLWFGTQAMNTAQPGSAYFAYYPNGHCCWNTMYDPGMTNWNCVGPQPLGSFITTGNSAPNTLGTYKTGDNLFKWMLKQGDTTLVGSNTTANLPPTANAGSNQTITLPASSVTLSGGGTDPDGTIASYAWTQISGTTATIASPSSASTNITGLTTAGARVFRLTVTDNSGATAYADVTVTVNAASNSSQSETHNFITYDTTINFTYVGSWNVRISRPANMFVPNDPDTASRPAIIFMVGVGEVGQGNFAALAYNGPHYWYGNGNGAWDGGIQLGNGKHYPIIISVSPWTAWPSTRSCGMLLEYLINTYHIKRNSVHITGLSMGAMSWSRMMNAQRTPGDRTWMKLVKSMTLLQGQGNAYYDSLNGAAYMLGGDVPVTDSFKAYGLWTHQYGGKYFGLEGTNDWRDMGTLSQAMQDSLPGSAYRAFENIGGGAHCCWNDMYDPGRTNFTSVGTLGPNITTGYYSNFMGNYQPGDYIFKWMLKQGDTSLAGSAPSNQPPVANAGANQIITLPTSSVTLSGSGTDADGTIASYAWSQVSGTAAIIVSPSSASTNITGLITAGARVFRLTVTDNSGATATSDVTITVNLLPGVLNVITNAAQTISISTASLASTASGNIASTKWTKFSVPGQPIKKLTIIGSSTAAGNGATATDSSLIGRLKNYYVAQGIITDITNLAVAGTSQWDLTDNNFAGLQNAFNTNPDVMLMAFPSNAYPYQTMPAIMAKFQEIYDSATNRGIVMYISGTQPRNDYDAPNRAKLVTINDSLRLRFPTRFIDFLTPLNNPVDNTMKPEYYADGIHPNNAGHGVISEVAKAANIFQNSISSASTIVSPTSANTSITGLTTGVHRFQVSVIDNGGFAASAVATVTVNIGNQPPVANAGSNQTITLPTSTVTLSGSGTDADGTVSSYAWTQLSGAAATIASASTASTGITGLTTAGVRVFRLTVTDNQGATGTVDVTVTVNPANGTPQNNVINVNLYDNNDPYSNTQWNNQLITQTYPYTSGTYTYSDGSASSIYSTISANQAFADNGAGYPTTMCPSAVGRYASYFPSTRTVTFKGLDNTKLYDIQLYCSRASAQGNTRNTINGVNIDIAVQNNYANIATYPNIAPSGGQIVLTQTVLSSYVYLNGFTLTEKTSAGNQAPTANAGTNQTITLPTSTVTLTGSGTDADGTIASYAWTQISGTTATIASPSTASTNITGLTTVGVRVFRLTVTDNQGATGTSDVTITVNAANIAPTANAGTNQTITLPASTVTLTGSGTDADGTIASYAWTQISGTAATIASPSTASTNITGLTTVGVRVFRLTVTDNQGATGTSDVTITVNAGNIAPIANAGVNQTIQLPTSAVTLSGSGTDADGTIASYAWTQISGTIATIASPSTASTNITGLTIAGVRVFRLTVTDNQGATGTSDVTITVNSAPPANQPPAANAGANQTIQLPTSAVTLSGSGTDADGTIVSYAWSQVSGTAATIVSPSTASTNITGLTTVGARVFRLTVTDNQGATGTSDVTITVNAANIAPVANAGVNQTIQLPTSTVTLSGSGTDADGTIALYAWTQISGTTATIGSPSALSTTITGLTTVGVRIFRLTVTDNQGATGTSDVTITVNAANIAPVANAGANQTIQLPTSAVTLSGSGTDADGTIVSYTWSQVSGTAATIVSPSTASTNITGLTTVGVRVFRLTVTDNQGATGISDVTITVNAANIAPVANAGANQTIQLPTSAVTLSGSGTDADGTIVSYTWSQVSGTSATIVSPSTASTNITGLTTAGVRVFRLTVTDNQGATGTSDVTITVNAGNIAPIANAGSDQTITLPTSAVTLSGSGADADGTIVSYAWSQVSGTTATISSPSTASTNITGLTTVGVRVFRLTVTDNQGATGTSDVTITVNSAPPANQPPTANAGANQTIQLPTSTVTLSGSGTDADGTIASYTWTQVSGTSATIVSPSTASTNITGLTTVGVRVFRLTVTDNLGATGTSDVLITVNAANIAPAANAGANQTIQLPVSSVTLSGSGSDADGTIVSYAWSQVGGTAATITTPSSASTTITGLTTVGVRVFRLTVTDNQGATGTSDVTITVIAANIAPIANAGVNQTIQLPISTVTLSGSGTDADGTIVSYAWSQVSGTAATITTPSSASTTITGLTTVGVRVFRLTVTDNQGATGTSDVTITVIAANIAPIANAGVNQTIQLPISTVTLSGSGTDADGTIVSYAWTQVSGTSATITTPSSASTTITGLTTVGVRVFRLTVTDNQGATGTSDVTITVIAGNIAPIANAGVNQTIQLPLSTVTLTGNGTDADGTIVSFSWTQISGTAATITSPSSATTTITGLTTAGVRVFRLTVTDNLGATGSSDVTITVNPAGNQLPTANAGVNQTIQLPISTVILSGSGTDPDGTIVLYSWSQVSGTAATITSPSSASTTITGLTTVGVRVFRLMVTDNQGGTATSDVTITVIAANQAPIASAGLNITIQLPLSVANLSGSGTDADGTIVSYGWTQISGTAATIASPSTASTAITGLTSVGVRVFRLTVTDNQGATGTSDVTITVIAANIAPLANAGANITIQLPVSVVNLSGTATDADGTIVSYGWTQISGTAATITSASSASTTITGLTTAGVRIFRLTVTDNQGATGTSDVTVTVLPANIPPTAFAGANQAIQLPASSITVSGSGVDPDGSIVSYQWSKIAGPTQYTIVSPTQAQTVINNLVEGVYQFELTVTDNQGATGRDTLAVTVSLAPPPVNQVPVAHAGLDQNITLPVNTVTLQGSGTDADGTVVSYLWSKINGPAQYTIVFPAQPGTVINNLVQGTYQFVLTITDNQGAIGRDTVIISVNAPVNQPPVAHAGQDQSITLPVDSVRLTGSGTDADGTIVSYQWIKISGPAQYTIISPAQAQTVITNLVHGTYQFELTVTDNQGASAKDTVSVTVGEALLQATTTKVYPNPATTMINIEIDAITNTNKTNLWIYGSGGDLLYQEEFVRNQQIIVKQVDVSKLKPGLYFIRIGMDPNNSRTLKFVKQ